MILGVLALPHAISVAQGLPRSNAVTPDYRLHCIRHLFAHSPLRSAAADLLTAADQNSLDWRLLPSIAIVESGGGKVCRNHNAFGWYSGKKSFPSAHAAIQFVASRLANSYRYRGKDLSGKLAAYNPVPGYEQRVIAVMESLNLPLIDRVSSPMVW